MKTGWVTPQCMGCGMNGNLSVICPLDKHEKIAGDLLPALCWDCSLDKDLREQAKTECEKLFGLRVKETGV